MKRRSKNIDRLWTILLSALIILLLLFWALCGMVFSDPYSGKLGLAASANGGELLQKLARGVISGETVRLNEEETNALITQAVKSLPQNTPLRVTGARVTLREDGHVDLYAPVKLKKANLGVSARASLQFDEKAGKLNLKMDSLHVGRLPVSPGFALRLARASLPAGISVNGSTLSLDASLFSVRLPGVEPVISLKSVRVESGALDVGVQSDISALKQYLLQNLPGLGKVLGLVS